jgi:hypothetical protein
MDVMRKEAKISPKALKVLSLILNVDGASKPHANMRELVLKMHPHLVDDSRLSRTPEYKAIANVWKSNAILLEWLELFYGGHREWNLSKCSSEELKVAQGVRERYASHRALREGLNSFFKGGRENYRTKGSGGISTSRARK